MNIVNILPMSLYSDRIIPYVIINWYLCYCCVAVILSVHIKEGSISSYFNNHVNLIPEHSQGLHYMAACFI